MKKKKVLILSYYYWPCRFIPVGRIKSFAEKFANEGCNVTVITRHWSGNENVWSDYLVSTQENEVKQVVQNNITTIYLPYKEFVSGKGKFQSQFNTIKNLLLGNFYANGQYTQLLQYIKEFAKSHEPDVILCSVYPLDLVHCGYEIKKMVPEAKWIVDFRDYQNFTLSIQDRLIHKCENFYLKKWLSKADLAITVSGPLATKLKDNTGKEAQIIYNGFDCYLFEEIKDNFLPSSEEFTISVLGTLYPQQNIGFMIEGFREFFKLINNDPSVKINFIGLEAIPQVASQIRDELKNYSITITPKVAHKEALIVGASSHVLYYIGWIGHKGIISGKIFDYLGLQRNILIAPDDHDVLHELINETESGKLADSTSEMGAILYKWYKEWKETGLVQYHGNDSIKKYSRNNQADILFRYAMSI